MKSAFAFLLFSLPVKFCLKIQKMHLLRLASRDFKDDCFAYMYIQEKKSSLYMYIYISNLKSRSPAEIKEIRRHPEGGTNFFLIKGGRRKKFPKVLPKQM